MLRTAHRASEHYCQNFCYYVQIPLVIGMLILKTWWVSTYGYVLNESALRTPFTAPQRLRLLIDRSFDKTDVYHR